jgi:uncharacterized membrane protein YeiH
MTNSIYVSCSFLAFLFVVIFWKQLSQLNNAWFIFDTVGLALFTIVGMQKTLVMGYPFWIAIVMGTITGAAGGIMRDVLINEEPLIFRKEIYALACIAGGVVYEITQLVVNNTKWMSILGFMTIFIVRVLAVKYHLCLPLLKDENNK